MYPAVLQELPRFQYGKITGYYAEGFLGQYLVIIPEARLVAVRMIRWRPDYDTQRDNMFEFKDLAAGLIRPDRTKEMRE
jgi:CubicO group peptidase (beta-lactamase class C family)